MNHNSIPSSQSVPVVSAPPPGAKPFTPEYDFYLDSKGQPCKVLRKPVPVQQTRTEFRCSPDTGRVYTVEIKVDGSSSQTGKYVWKCDPLTGERYQVLSSAPGAAPACEDSRQSPGPPWSSSIGQHQSQVERSQHHQPSGDLDLELQNQVKGIVKLCGGGGVTKKASKPLDFAQKASAKWAKKATLESINLPLYTYGAISELESALSGRSAPLPEGEFLAKLRHIRNVLDVCCLNSESTDFKGYGWVIAKDYCLKVENDIEQQSNSWETVSAGIQTSQLLLAQMDFPKPLQPKVPLKSGTASAAAGDGKDKKARCTTYNSCKTEDKCDFEIRNPDKKCFLKHECSWCKDKLRQSWRHQEWNCKKKN